MARPNFEWKRFWVPSGERMNLDGGYLIDPDGKFGRAFNPKAISLAQLSDQRCLALLGEPGMGKTTAMEDSRAELEKRASSAGEAFLWPDLRICGSDIALDRYLFETQEFTSWVTGRSPLNLFLDGFDECVLRIGVLVPLLISRLRSGDPSKLRLSIACRTAEWPRPLDAGLAEIFGKDFHRYELAPLRKIDVSRAAATCELDVERFLAEVDHREAVPFAIKPVTLNMLLQMFKQSGHLPSDLASLYRAGCEALCEETNETRTGRSAAPRLSAKQRVHISRRVAAIMAFCQRTSILRQGGTATPEPTDLTIEDILGTGRREIANDGDSEMTMAAVAEALDTGLFSGHGPERLGCAHRTYLEFLAAEYVLAHGFSAEQIADLIMHPSDQAKVVPQLHGVAAWLAGKNQDVFDRICATDPRVLLAADMATLDDGRKGQLADSFLGEIERRSAPFDWEVAGHFGRLKHSGLALRLQRYIESGTWSVGTRVIAIEIAKECGATDLQELLIKIALDDQENIDVRVYAVSAIGRIADNAAKLRLRPLAEGNSTDREDQLKGEALASLRGIISTKEILGLMSAPANSHHWSTYWFFAQDLTRSLTVADLPDALEWATRFPSQRHYYFEGARNAIVRAAQDHLDVPAVLTAFAKFARARMRESEPIWDTNAPVPEGLDRSDLVGAIIDGEETVAEVVAPTPSFSSALDWSRQMVGETPLVRPEDLGWVVDRFMGAEAGPRAGWAELLKVLVLDICVGKHSIDPVIEAAEQAPELHELLPNTLGSVEIGSEKARQLEARTRAWQQPSERRRDGPSLAERMTEQLSSCEHDVAIAFPELVNHMAFGDKFSDTADRWAGCLHEFPGWRDVDDSTRRRILNFGKAYLCSFEVESPQRTGREFTVLWTVQAAYLTLRLLEDVEPEWLSGRTPSDWHRWATFVVDHETWAAEATRLLDRAMERAPNETIARIVTLIDWEDRTYGRASTARRLVRFWNRRLEEILLAQARAPGRSPSTVGELLELLLSRGSEDSVECARSFLPATLPDESRARDLAREAGVALLVQRPALGWSSVQPIVVAHPDIGRDIAIRTAAALFGRERAPWADALAPAELADVYLWLCREFPHSEDPVRRGAGTIGGREQVAGFRDFLLTNLGNRATSVAVDELIKIGAQPGTPDIRHLIAQARHKALEASWTSPTPQQFLRMAENHQQRLVESGEQLKGIVLESLTRYQGELRGEIPAYEDLWNEVGKNRWRPKKEDFISSHIARHLRRDLTDRSVIINREVQIRPSPGGQRTDIHVDAVRQSSNGSGEAQLKVIIEVKGIWNKSLKIAMKEQLRDKYLKENDCRHGIYLVVWFNCNHWDPQDGRCSDAKSWGLDETRAYFDSQAKALSTDQCSLAAFVVDARLGQ